MINDHEKAKPNAPVFFLSRSCARARPHISSKNSKISPKDKFDIHSLYTSSQFEFQWNQLSISLKWSCISTCKVRCKLIRWRRLSIFSRIDSIDFYWFGRIALTFLDQKYPMWILIPSLSLSLTLTHTAALQTCVFQVVTMHRAGIASIATVATKKEKIRYRTSHSYARASATLH